MGYHIIMMEDREESQTKPFEAIKDSLKKQLTEKLIKAKVDEFIKKAHSDSGLEIYLDRITGGKK